MVSNIKDYKEGLLTKKDKWGDTPAQKVVEKIGELQIDESEKPEQKVTNLKASGVGGLNALVKELDKVVVQKYIEKPLLIKGHKFDLRMFMIVICARPYFVLDGPGYARLSLNQFTVDDFNNKEMADESRITHLTNASVQRKHKQFKELKETSIMSLDGLRDYLIETKQLGSIEEFETKVCGRMREIMKLIFNNTKSKLDCKFGCFELYGFDFMLDDELNPYLLEINCNPALFTDTEVQKDIMPKLVEDVCDLAIGVHANIGETESTVEKIREVIASANLRLDYKEVCTD